MILTIYLTAETIRANQDQSEYWAEYWAKKRGLEPAIIKAIARKESSSGRNKERVEPHLVNSKWYLALLTEEEKKDPYSFFSMGDMQILYGIAKHLGFRGKPHLLLHPEIGYKWGTLYFKKLCKSEKLLERAISSYNQGKVTKKDGTIYKSKYIDKNNNGIKDKWEKWKNQYYVNKVLKYYKKYGGTIECSF